MAIKVNPPPQIRLPKSLANDRESAAYFKNLDRMLLQLWRRTGGSTDAVEEAAEVVAAGSSELLELKARIGSGISVTMDTTGFTVDTTKLTTDQTEM